MTLVELGAYLVAASLGLTVGGNLFYGPVQDRPETTTVVGLIPGIGPRASEPGFGAADLVYEWPRVQVVVRGPAHDLEAALVMAQGVYRTLGAVQAQALAGTFYHQVTCLHPPAYLRHDDNDRPLVVVNVQIEKRVSA